MHQPGSDFEREAHASEAVEAGRLSSPWHRRFVWGLGVAACWLWAVSIFLIWSDGFGSFLGLPPVMADPVVLGACVLHSAA